MSTPLPVTVLLADPTLPDASKPGGHFTDDDHDQVLRLRRALAELPAYRFEYWNEHATMLERLRARRPGFVLNFCDTGYRNRATRELHLPAYLEMHELAYSGCGPVALGLCYDKSAVRAIAAAHGVPVPWEMFIGAGDEPSTLLDTIAYPAFVKPNCGDGSVGISARSIVADAAQASRVVRQLRDMLPGASLIVQEYLDGAEYGVGIVGNPGFELDVLPALEVDYSDLDPALPRLLDYGSKTDPESPYWGNVKFRRARLDRPALGRIVACCERLFERLGLRDYARFDFRTSASGEIKLMEVNPNPAWCHDGKLAHMVQLRGERHAALLARIIEAARMRTHAQAGEAA